MKILVAQWLNAPPPPQISVEEALKASGADAVYYGTQMRGASNAKAKRELNFQPRSLEWSADTAVIQGGRESVPPRVGNAARGASLPDRLADSGAASVAVHSQAS